MELYDNKEECCGCGACADACANKAITLFPDELGFMYPTVDNEFCVNCGRCRMVCPLKHEGTIKSLKTSYVAASRNSEQKKASSSGGIFPILAQQFIDAGGVVIGAAFDRDETGKLYVHHLCAEAPEELLALQNSKYVQSSTAGIYRKVKELLQNKKRVLFTGTPCQAAGLYYYLGRNYEGLFTAETICHGVPSKRLFQDYIKFLENKLNGQVESFCFRDKTKGWGKITKVIYVNKRKKRVSKIIPYFQSSYFTLFLKGDVLRESCYKCRFASEYRAADITLGDYWGVKWEHPEILAEHGGAINEKQGVSCIIVNHEKGKQLIQFLQGKADIADSDYEKIAPHNKQIKVPLPQGKNREEVFKIYLRGGYEALNSFTFKKYKLRDCKQRIRIAVTDFLKETPVISQVYRIAKSSIR